VASGLVVPLTEVEQTQGGKVEGAEKWADATLLGENRKKGKQRVQGDIRRR